MVKFSEILNIGLFQLKLIRQRPIDGRLGTFVSISFLLVTIFYTILTVMLFFYIDGDIDQLARTTESLTSFCQTFIKLIPLLIHRERLKQLFDSTEFFWNPDDYPKLVPKVEKIFKASYYFQNAYRSAIFATLIFFYFQPLVQKDLLIVAYVPKSVPYAFEMLLIGEYFYAFVLANYMSGFDTLYVAFSTHLIIQLKCLNHVMANLSMQPKMFRRDIRRCVEHHRFIFRYAIEMVNIYSLPLLGQYIITTYLTCMEIYLLSESFGNPMRVVLSLLYTMSLLFQFACYCFPASEFSSEAMALADSVYASRWYEGTISQQRDLSFMILRAQREFKFTAAGLAEINRNAFAAVVKTAISFFTLMRQLKEES